MSADLLEAFGSEVPPSRDDRGNLSVPAPNLEQFFPRPRPLVIDYQNVDTEHRVRPLWETDRHGADVLFDASDNEAQEDSGNEFGDFEDAQQLDETFSPSHHNHVPAIDLLGLHDVSSEPRIPQPGVSGHTNASDDPFAIFGLSNSQLQTVSHPATTQQSSGYRVEAQASGNDEWGNFEDAEIVPRQLDEHITPTSEFPKRPSSSSQPSVVQPTSDEEWEKFDDEPEAAAASIQSEVMTARQGFDGPVGSAKDVHAVPNTDHTRSDSAAAPIYPKERPTNIPPPFSLLQLLTPAVQALSSLCRPVPPEHEVHQLANIIISLYRTTSRIIAGRSHRWKRDVILAQSMRISFAGHKTTGMKLTSLDRSESIKEDQEAIEAASSWTKHNHALNPVLLKAKLPKPAMSLSANMKTRPATGPGVLNEREPCVICGLKRNERVVGIDVKLDDIFDEFWIEHWGHTECRRFWYDHKSLLSQR